MAVQIQMRRGTLSQWATANPTLADGEWGLETDTNKFKIGNGTDAWNSITTYSSLGIGTAGGTFAGTVNFGADGTGQDVNFYSLTGGDHMKWDASEEQLIIEGTNGTVALHVTDGDVTIADGDLTVSGDLTINGATTTVSTTNTLVEDSLIELNTGASSNANDLGIVMERGSTGNNAIIAWDESADKFTMGTTTATGASTGDLSITAGTLVADLEGDVTGDVTGNASTATALATARTIGGTSFDGTANVVPGTITVADTTDTTCNVALFESATGDLAPKSDAGMTYNAGTGTLTVNTDGGGYEGPHIVGMPTAKSTHYTLALADAGKMIRMNSTSANNLTIPNNSTEAFPVGTQILINVMNTGTTTIAAAGGVVRDSKDDKYDIDGRYATVALIKTETNNWTLTGPLA
jgi:hypothetical protein